MVGYAPTSDGPAPVFGGVWRRVSVCLLAASLALLNWDWLPPVSLRGPPGILSTGVTVNGVRIDLVCRGRGDSTVVIVDHPVVTRSIDDSVQEELARYVRVCTLTVVETASRHDTPGLAAVLPGLLIGGDLPAPYVIISHTSPATVLEWEAGPTANQFVGFVLIDPPDQPASLVVSVGGDQRSLPLDDRNATVIAILSLFWPPDDA